MISNLIVVLHCICLKNILDTISTFKVSNPNHIVIFFNMKMEEYSVLHSTFGIRQEVRVLMTPTPTPTNTLKVNKINKNNNAELHTMCNAS